MGGGIKLLGNHNRMIEVVCEGFGDGTNENARDWLWVVLVAGQPNLSPYLLVVRTLVPMAHSSPMAAITVTCRKDETRVSQTCETQSSQFDTVLLSRR